MSDQIELREGDYVLTYGMTVDEYHAVAKAFMEAGANDGEYPAECWAEDGMGKDWAVGIDDGAVWHGQCGAFVGRQLTIEQVLGARKQEDKTMHWSELKVGDIIRVDEGDKGSQDYNKGKTGVVDRFYQSDDEFPVRIEPCGHSDSIWYPDWIRAEKFELIERPSGERDGEDNADAEESGGAGDLMQTLIEKRNARDKAQAEYQEALQAVRDKLPGFRTEERDEPQEDMSDPDNWREGDVVEFVAESGDFYSNGNLYRVEMVHHGVLFLSDDDDGDHRWPLNDHEADAVHHQFRFHHRPA